MQRVFGWVKQNAAGAAHREATQARDAGGDRHGQIESEEGFTAFGLAANDADGFFRPQPIDEPALLLGQSARRQAGWTGSWLIAGAGLPPWPRSP